MPLTLRILSYRNQPVPGAASGRFSEAGGTLGRSSDNVLVLDDPGKYISRVHARVSFRDGAFFLEDVGSNASVINDRPLGKGREIQLGDGDRVAIGDYQLQAVLEGAPVAARLLPSAPLNNPELPLFVPPPPPAPVHLPPLQPVAAAPQPGAYATGLPDALAGASILDVGPASLLGAPGNDPLGLNLFGSGAAQATPARAADSDHLSPELAAFQMPQPASIAAPPVQTPPIQAAAPAPRPADAFAIPHDYDPLADFLPRAVPPVAPASTVPRAPAEAAPQQTHSPQIDAKPVLDATPENVPAPRPAPSPQHQALADATAIGALGGHEAAASAPATVRTPAPVQPKQPASDSDILQALLRGLGLPDLMLNRSGPEVAETAGAMLREATAGTIDVLMARAMTKKESRIEMTMLSVRANNPLKFFPNSDGALTQMLTNSMTGYLPPVQAMAEAFDDLRAHELAVIAGMRAALAAVLHRFDPAQIERRLAVPTVMDKMLSANRKAKLWDRLVELYGEIAREADDDLQRLFGEKFSEAYEAQVARLRAAKSK